MFDNAGYSIKRVIKTITGLLIVFSVLVGIAVLFLFISDHRAGLGLLLSAIIIGGGCFFAWLSGLLVYAFGDIADNVESIKEALTEKDNNNPKNNPTNVASTEEKVEEPKWKCYSCGAQNVMARSYCVKCNVTRSWSEHQWSKKK